MSERRSDFDLKSDDVNKKVLNHVDSCYFLHVIYVIF